MAIMLIAGAAAIAGAVPTRIYGHDIFVILDGGWRVLNGQRPQVDFGPGIGPLTSVIVAAGLKLAGNSVHGVGIADALTAIVAGAWAYLLGRGRMAWMPAALIACGVALFAAAPYPVGLPPNEFSHAMTYNRFGYALLGVLMVESFVEVRGGGVLRIVLRGLSAGVIIILLVLLKPSYGAVALMFFAVTIPLQKLAAWRTLGMLAGVVIAALAWMIYLRFDFAGVLTDFKLMAGARSGGLSVWAIRWALFKGLAGFLWPAALAFFVAVIRDSGKPLRSSFDLVAMALAVLAGQALILATNAQPSGYPLNGIFGILLAERARVAAEEKGLGAMPGFLRPATVLVLIGTLCFVPTFTANLAGVTGALAQRFAKPPAALARFQPPHLAELILYDVTSGSDEDERSNGHVYVNYLNDGVALIQRVSASPETVYTLDLANPFSYALLRRPPHGGMACMDYNAQFNDRFKPSPERLFGAADIVMVPKHPSATQETTQALARNYLASLQAEYRVCAESDWWKLYKRPGNLGGCPGR